MEIDDNITVGGLYRNKRKNLFLFPPQNLSALSVIRSGDIITILGVEENIGFTNITVKVLHKDNIGLVFFKNIDMFKAEFKIVK